MAAPYIECDQSFTPIRKMVSALQKAREAREDLRIAIRAMEALRDGDGSSASHYALLASEGGYQSGGYADSATAAKASYDQAASVYGKLSKLDGDATGPAIDQACAYHGI